MSRSQILTSQSTQLNWGHIYGTWPLEGNGASLATEVNETPSMFLHLSLSKILFLVHHLEGSTPWFFILQGVRWAHSVARIIYIPVDREKRNSLHVRKTHVFAQKVPPVRLNCHLFWVSSFILPLGRIQLGLLMGFVPALFLIASCYFAYINCA